MPGNAVLEIEHDTQAIYYPCVLNLGYRIVCPTISFWSSGKKKGLLIQAYIFSRLVFYVHKQIKPSEKNGGNRWRICLQAQKKDDSYVK